MSLVELLPTVRSLSRLDKLRLVRVWAEELTEADGTDPIVADRSCELWSPDRAYDAASILLQVLRVDDRLT